METQAVATHRSDNSREQPSQRNLYRNEHYAAEYYGVSVATIRRWRLVGDGPPYRKFGASVRYSQSDLDAWANSRPTGGGKAGAV
jgi:predicted DNA-binding transcriptional regulator AlpA